MKQINELSNYFISGFQLLNKVFLVFVVAALFELVNLFLSLAEPTNPTAILPLHMLVVILSMTFSFIAPLYFIKYQKDKSISLDQIFNIYKENIRHTFVPVVSLIALMFLSILVVVGPFIGVMNMGLKQIENTPFYIVLQILNPVLLLTLFIFYLFMFTPIFFNIEKLSIFESLKKSVLTSLKNLKFLWAVILIIFLSNFVILYVPSQILPGQILKTVLLSYINFIVTASALIYYQKNIRP